GRKVLGITGGAAVAAGKHFALIEQGVDHYLAGLLDVRCKYVHRLLLGVDAGLKKLANSGLHVHLCDLNERGCPARESAARKTKSKNVGLYPLRGAGDQLSKAFCNQFN